ncbi:MAG: hypothetical protein AB1445_11575 [Bacillota bacterium]
MQVPFYVAWLGHCLLLAVFYHPVFGGETPGAGKVARAISAWSRTRVAAALLVQAMLFVPVLVLSLIFQARGPEWLAVASGFWFVVAARSFVEVGKKLYGLKLW